MAAYGLLQGWDGALQFGYFSGDFRRSLGEGSFDMLGNQPQILQFPAIAAMWYRQDVKEAEVVAESVYDSESVYQWTEDRKPVPLWAALVGKVLGDVLLTREEFLAMAEGRADTDGPATGMTSLARWIADHAEHLGVRYANELDRHFR